MQKLVKLILKSLVGLGFILSASLVQTPATAATGEIACSPYAISAYITTYSNSGSSYFAGEDNANALQYGFKLKAGYNPWSFTSGYAHDFTSTPTGSNGFNYANKTGRMHMKSTGGVKCYYDKTFALWWNMYGQVTPKFAVSVSNNSPAFADAPATMTIKATTPSPSIYGNVEGILTLVINGQRYSIVLSNGSGSAKIIEAKEYFQLQNSWWKSYYSAAITPNMYNGINSIGTLTYVPTKGRFISVSEKTNPRTYTMPNATGKIFYQKKSPLANTNPWQEAKDNLALGAKNINGVSYAGVQTGGCVLNYYQCYGSFDGSLMSEMITKYNVLDPGIYCQTKCIPGTGMDWYDIQPLNDLNYGDKWWMISSQTVEQEHNQNAIRKHYAISCQRESVSVSARYFDNGQSYFGQNSEAANYKEMIENREYRFNITNNNNRSNGSGGIYNGMKATYSVTNDDWQSVYGGLWASSTAGGWSCNYPASKSNASLTFDIPAPQKFSTSHSVYITDLSLKKVGDSTRKIKAANISIKIKNMDTGAVSTVNTSCHVTGVKCAKVTLGMFPADADGTTYQVTATWNPDAAYDNNRIFNTATSATKTFTVYRTFSCNFSQANKPIVIDYINPETGVTTPTGKTDTSLIRSGKPWKVTYPDVDTVKDINGMIGTATDVASRTYIAGTPIEPAEVRMFRGYTDDAGTMVEMPRQTPLLHAFGGGLVTQGYTQLGNTGSWYKAYKVGSVWKMLPQSSNPATQIKEYVSITWPSMTGPTGVRIPFKMVRDLAVYGTAFDQWQKIGEQPNIGWHYCNNPNDPTLVGAAWPTGNPQTSQLTIVSGHLSQ